MGRGDFEKIYKEGNQLHNQKTKSDEKPNVIDDNRAYFQKIEWDWN